jgi:allantoinase
VAISLVMNFEEGSEQQVGDGDPQSDRGLTELPGSHHWPPDQRDLTSESMHEYGTRAGLWRFFDIFDEHEVPATFYACALALERNPDVAAAIRPAGHDVVCHGYRWEQASFLTREEEKRRMLAAVESITRTTGARPKGWFCRYGPSVNTRELVVEEGGFTYDCDAYNDDLPYWTTVLGRRHLVIPYDLDANDGAYSSQIVGSPREFGEHLRYDFDRLYAEGEHSPKLMSVGLHLRLSGYPARAKVISDFIAYAASFPRVWFATRGQIAEHWYREHAP